MCLVNAGIRIGNGIVCRLVLGLITRIMRTHHTYNELLHNLFQARSFPATVGQEGLVVVGLARKK